MTSIEYVTLEVADPAAAGAFYTAAFGLGTQVRLRASEAPTAGFRGFTLNLGVSQPATVNGLIGTALDVGATPLKPATKQFWGGYSGVAQAPDGVEEGHRPGHPADRRDRAPAGSRRCGREQTVLH